MLVVLAILTFIFATMLSIVAFGSFGCAVLSTGSLIVSPFTKRLSCENCIGAFLSTTLIACMLVPLAGVGSTVLVGIALQILDPLHNTPSAPDFAIALGLTWGIALAILGFFAGMTVKESNSWDDFIESLILM